MDCHWKLSNFCAKSVETFSHIEAWSLCVILSVQFSSVAQLCPTLCDPVDCCTPGIPVHCQLPEFTQTHVHWISNAIQPSHPLPSPSSPAFNLSQHLGLFSESALCIRWPEYWSFSFSMSPSNEHPGPISFRMDWLDLLAVQGTLKSLILHHSSKASIFRHLAFFWRRKWQPPPVLLPGKSHGLRILVGYSPWGRRVGHNWATSLT